MLRIVNRFSLGEKLYSGRRRKEQHFHLGNMNISSIDFLQQKNIYKLGSMETSETSVFHKTVKIDMFPPALSAGGTFSMPVHRGSPFFSCRFQLFAFAYNPRKYFFFPYCKRESFGIQYEYMSIYEFERRRKSYD